MQSLGFTHPMEFIMSNPAIICYEAKTVSLHPIQLTCIKLCGIKILPQNLNISGGEWYMMCYMLLLNLSRFFFSW